MNILIAFGVAGLVGFGSYVLGLRRGIKIAHEEGCEEYKDAYWEGYNDGRLDPMPNIMQETYDEAFQAGKEAKEREYKANVLLAGLEEAFDGCDDEVIIDGGTY